MLADKFEISDLILLSSFPANWIALSLDFYIETFKSFHHIRHEILERLWWYAKILFWVDVVIMPNCCISQIITTCLISHF